MWKFSFRKKPSRLQTAIGSRLGSVVLCIQKKWADYMGRKTEGLPLSQRKIALMLFCISFGAGSAGVFYQAIHPGKITIQSPAYRQPQRAFFHTAEPQPTLTNGDKQAIQTFRHRIDSISLTPDGKEQINRFLRLHPGLMDSLRLAEQAFNQP